MRNRLTITALLVALPVLVGSSDAVGGLGGSIETPGGRCAAWLAEGIDHAWDRPAHPVLTGRF
jgi:hypothetical protein